MQPNSESIFVLYYIGDQKDDALDGLYPNCCELRISAGAEIYLLDFLLFLITAKVGCHFTVWSCTSSSGAYDIPIPSSTSVLPVHDDGTIKLLLIKSKFGPYVPIDQGGFFADLSRRAIYSRQNYNEIQNSPPLTTSHLSSRQEKRSFSLFPKEIKADNARSAGNSSSTSPSVSSFSTSHSSSTVINNKSDSLQSKPPEHSANKYNNDSYQKSRHTDEYSHSRTTSSSRNPKSGSGGSGSIGDEGGQGFAEVAGVLGKSLFSFAKSVVDATTQHAANLTSQLGTVVSGPLASGQSIQVGSYRVNVVRLLAEGGFGCVYLVSDRGDSGRQMALKILNCQTKEQVQDAQLELNALRQCSGHQNIINLLDYSQSFNPHGGSGSATGSHTLFLYPLFPLGTAWDAIENAQRDDRRWPFSEKRALQIVLGMARALDFMHGKNLAHSDVKPHNVLLNEENVAVLMDLGSVTTARRHISTRKEALNVEEEAASKTSAPYRPPELTSVPNPIQLDERTDIWGLGCSMFCLAFGYSPFETPKEGLSRLAILNARYFVPTGRRTRDCIFSEAYTGLIDSMLQLDISKRPFAKEVEEKVEKILRGR